MKTPLLPNEEIYVNVSANCIKQVTKKLGKLIITNERVIFETCKLHKFMDETIIMTRTEILTYFMTGRMPGMPVTDAIQIVTKNEAHKFFVPIHKLKFVREQLNRLLEGQLDGATQDDEKEEDKGQQIDEKSRYCGRCGELNAGSASYCQNCGSKLVPTTVRKCSSCGATCEEKQKYCTKCGQLIDNHNGEFFEEVR